MCHKTRSLDKYETLDGTLSVHVIRNREAGVLKKNPVGVLLFVQTRLA